jgi:hypothetical protein
MVSFIFAPLVVMSFGVPVVFWWLRKHGVKNAQNLVLGDHMAGNLKLFSARVAQFLVAAHIIIFLSYFIPIFVTRLEGFGSSLSSGTVVLAIFKTTFVAIVIQYPYIKLLVLFSALATLYYAESRRLRHMIKDVVALMRQRPFNFAVVAPAYSHMVSEWEESQARMGPIASVLAGCLLASMCSQFVILMYSSHIASLASTNGGSGPSLSSSVFEPLTTIISGTVNVAVLLTMFLFLAYGMIGANHRVRAIADECTELISTSSAKSLSLPLPSSVGTFAAVHNDHGDDAVKLALLVERRPCELKLLGRAISVEDVVGVVFLFIVAQLVNAVSS